MEIYLKCLIEHKVRDHEGHPLHVLETGHIYKATNMSPKGNFYNINTEGLWSTTWFKELSKVEVFIELKGQMHLVEELP